MLLCGRGEAAVALNRRAALCGVRLLAGHFPVNDTSAAIVLSQHIYLKNSKTESELQVYSFCVAC